MNKRDLIDALSGRLGDKKSATEALNAVLETIQSAVASGDKVAITGFGVFEKSERPARTARNPATGAEIQRARELSAEVPPRGGLQGPGQRGQAGRDEGGPQGRREEEVTASVRQRAGLSPRGIDGRRHREGIPRSAGPAPRCVPAPRSGQRAATDDRPAWPGRWR